MVLEGFLEEWLVWESLVKFISKILVWVIRIDIYFCVIVVGTMFVYIYMKFIKSYIYSESGFRRVDGVWKFGKVGFSDISESY